MDTLQQADDLKHQVDALELEKQKNYTYLKQHCEACMEPFVLSAIHNKNILLAKKQKTLMTKINNLMTYSYEKTCIEDSFKF